MKQQLRDKCIALLQEKVTNAQQDIQKLQTSLQEETKSSVGDKYETGRAMIHIQMHKLKSYLMDQENMLHVIDKIDMTPATFVKNGSLVKTTMGWLWLSVSLGKVKVENEDIILLSNISPLGKMLLGKSKGDEFVLNNKKISIHEIL